MTSSIQMLVLSAILAIVSLTIPTYGTNLLWVADPGYSFLLQVALPRIGIAISSIIGGYAGVKLFQISRDDDLKNLAIPLAMVAIALLIGGLFIEVTIYVYMYTLICPTLIGLGIAKLSNGDWIRKPGIILGFIAGLFIAGIILVAVGITSRDWIMVIDLGTGMRVLSASMIGALLKIR